MFVGVIEPIYVSYSIGERAYPACQRGMAWRVKEPAFIQGSRDVEGGIFVVCRKVNKGRAVLVEASSRERVEIEWTVPARRLRGQCHCANGFRSKPVLLWGAIECPRVVCSLII